MLWSWCFSCGVWALAQASCGSIPYSHQRGYAVVGFWLFTDVRLVVARPLILISRCRGFFRALPFFGGDLQTQVSGYGDLLTSDARRI